MTPSPFPGMDPYLEQPELWSEVHSRLIVAIADRLSELLSEAYRVAIEKRIYLNTPNYSSLVGIPDVAVLRPGRSQPPSTTATLPQTHGPMVVTVPMADEVQERYLEIREVVSGAVITAIEILSPSNKRPGAGRQAYERKRYGVLGSMTHLVELDLLRVGERLPMQGASAFDYHVLISRAPERPQAQLYGFTVRQPLPTIPIPLQPGESEPLLDLQAIFVLVYRRGRYHLAVDYLQPPIPPLAEDDRAWWAARKQST
ncbi:MAG: DUF4058 family protein [Cyanobacteria bacterium P01_G01_bin.54]